MRILISFILFLITVENGSAQDFTKKKRGDFGFTQSDWLETMTELAKDTSVIRQLQEYSGGFIPFDNHPYVCFIAENYPVVFQFCPECVWIVDTCMPSSPANLVSVSTKGDYALHLKNISTNCSWERGDTVTSVLLVLCTRSKDYNHGYLIPVVAPSMVPAFPMIPKKIQRRILKR